MTFIAPHEFLHNEGQLEEVARGIFHGEEPGPLLYPVPQFQLPQLQVILGGMEQRRQEFLREADASLDNGEVSVIAVFPSSEGHRSPWFAYTVGLWPDHGGELVVRGFGDKTADIASRAIEWVKEGRVTLAEGDYTLADGERPMVRVVPFAGDPKDFGFANRRHGMTTNTIEYPRWHLVMADDEGRFPGDEGCECAEFQMLGLDFWRSDAN